MNQILSVESPKKEKKKKVRNSGPIEIDKILRFFSIAILIFGVFMIGTGSYSMYQDSKIATASNKPTIHIEESSATEITLQVTHDKNLLKVTYQWNDEDKVELNCAGKKKVEEKITIPTGENTLKVYALDVNGQESGYQKTYTVEGNINIEIKLEENKKDIKITATGKEQLSYMTYRWDDEDETRIDIDSQETEQVIEAQKGLHTLTVVVVDINNETQKKEQQVQGVTKPKIEVTKDKSNNIVIKASDEEGIKKIEFIINENKNKVLDVESALPLEKRKEIKYKYPLQDDDNKLEIKVYNESDACETKTLVRK